MKKEEQKEKKNQKYAKYASAIAICTVMTLSLFLAATLAASDVEKGRTDPATIEEAHAVFNITEAVLEAEEGTPTEEEEPTLTTNKSETDDTISSPGRAIEEAYAVFNITEAVLEAEEGTPTEEEEEPTPITNESETDDTISSPGWTTIELEGFGSGWPATDPKWHRSGRSTCGYTWDEDTYRHYQGSYSAWCADWSLGGCSDLEPERNNYPNNMDGWMVYGPFDLSDADDARMTFYHRTITELGYDAFYYYKSRDGVNWVGLGRTGSWLSGPYTGGDGYRYYKEGLPLSDCCGDPSVYVAFRFASDYSYTYEGTYVDNVWIEKHIPQPVLCTSPTDAPNRNFGNVPVGQTRSWPFGIRNCGSGTLDWTVSDDRTWIMVNPPNGRTTTETDTVTVNIDTTGLTPLTTYTGHVTVSSNGGTKTGTITVTVPDGGTTTVKVDPATQEVPKGSTFPVRVKVDPAVPILGVQFDMSFNPSLVRANSVTEGNLLNQDGADTFFDPGTIDNTAGTITGVAGAIIGGGAAVSGSGTFATISFTAKMVEGTSPLDLSNVVVGDSSGAVPRTVYDGSVTVKEEVCPCDCNGDRAVNVLDMIIVGQCWNQHPNPGDPCYPADVNKDGVVNVLDMIDIGQDWGPCPP